MLLGGIVPLSVPQLIETEGVRISGFHGFFQPLNTKLISSFRAQLSAASSKQASGISPPTAPHSSDFALNLGCYAHILSPSYSHELLEGRSMCDSSPIPRQYLTHSRCSQDSQELEKPGNVHFLILPLH